MVAILFPFMNSTGPPEPQRSLSRSRDARKQKRVVLKLSGIYGRGFNYIFGVVLRFHIF